MRTIVLLLLLGLLITSCGGNSSNSATEENDEDIPELVHLIDRSSGDTIPTGEYLPFDTSGNHHKRTPKVLAGKGIPSALNPIPLKSNQGVVTKKGSDEFILDSAFTLMEHNPDAVPPREVFVEPNITSVKEPLPKPVLPSVYHDNAQYDIRYLSSDQGLPSNSISGIMKDQNGYMWFGTDKGLIRYDGNFIKIYDESCGLAENVVTAITEDQDQNIWIGTRSKGIIKFDGNQFYQYSIDSIALSRGVSFLTVDQDNVLWSTIEFGGFNKFDGEKFTCYQGPQGVVDTRPTTWIGVDSKNRKWVTGFGTHGYVVKENDSVVVLHGKYKTNTYSSYINHVSFDQNDEPIFSFWGGAFAWKDKDTISSYTIDSVTISDVVASTYEDKDGYLWVCGYGAGVYRWDPDKNEVILLGEDQGLSSRFVTSMVPDENGFWVGSEAGGVCFITPKSFTRLNKEKGFKNHTVYEVVEEPKGTFYYATNKGIVIHDKTGMYQLGLNQNKKIRSINNVAHDLLIHNNGTKWLMTMNGGLLHVKKNGSIIKMSQNTGGAWNPESVDTTSDGAAWIVGMNQPLIRIDDTSAVAYSVEQNLILRNFNEILITDEDRMWLATQRNGLTEIYQDSLRYITVNEGLHSNLVNHLAEDHQGRIWIATDKGLNYIENGQVKSIDDPNLIVNCKSIIQDSENRYWIATDKDLKVLVPRVIPQETWNFEDFYLHTFDKGNGLSNVDFLPASIYIDSENRLMVGSSGGLIIRDLDYLQFDRSPPTCNLEAIFINGEAIDFRNLDKLSEDDIQGVEDIEFSSVPPFSNVPSELKLPHYLNHVTFEFSGLNWSDPFHIRYYYYLEGYEEDWNLSRAHQNTADYRNLSYGEYTFHIRAETRGGVSSDEYTYSFNIMKPWWQTWWARILFVLLIGGVVFGLIKWRTLELKKRQKILEKEIDQATEKIRSQKNQVEAQKAEMEKAHVELNEKNREILDSIQYAKRIQDAIMPPIGVFQSYLKNSFVYYKPKDIVAGDFYWMEVVDDNVLFAAADCTGHGVPGAMVSVICNNSLNRSVREYGLTEPGEILDKTKEIVVEEFDKAEEDVKDGMDIALCSFNIPTRTLKFAGANNPLWIIRKGELIEFKGNKLPIGKSIRAELFTTHKLDVYKNDLIYLFTDGFADQFGGDKGKKLKVANFKKLLLSIHDKSMPEQIEAIEKMFEEWKGEFEQLDDVCVIGVRV